MFSFSGFIFMGAIGARPKVFLAFFMLLTLLFTIDQKPFLAGLNASLSFLCWQPSLLFLVLLVLFAFFHQARIKKIATILFGAALPIFTYEAYFILTSSLGQPIDNKMRLCYKLFMRKKDRWRWF
jgi:hypothetical protein